MRILLTGGSVGLGATLAEELVNEDHRKVLNISRRPCVVIPNKDGGSIHSIMANVHDVDSILKNIPTDWTFDTFIFNAAIQNRHSSQWNRSEWLHHLEVNCLAQCDIYEGLKARGQIEGSHSVIVMSSEAASNGSRWAVAYAMSKAALEAYWKSQYLCDNGLSPNILILKPGRINTPGNPKRDLPDDDPNPFQEPEEVTPIIRDFIKELAIPEHTSCLEVDLGK